MNQWNLTAAALGGTCLGAFGIRALAWHAGNDADALRLLGCHLLRSIVLVLAWAMVATVLRAAARKEKPTAGTGFSFAETLTVLLLVPGCVGCFPAWPIVLGFLTAQLLLTPLFAPPGDRPARTDIIRAGIAVVLFTFTWYLCATTTRQALRGLGERIDARGGSERLRAWAAEVLATHRQRERDRSTLAATGVVLAASPQGPLLAIAAGSLATDADRGGLAPADIPPWVDDLLGRFQGIRSIGVENAGGEAYVALRTGGSAYHFRIQVCPTKAGDGPRPWWIGDDGSTWRPGIYLGTEGK